MFIASSYTALPRNDSPHTTDGESSTEDVSVKQPLWSEKRKIVESPVHREMDDLELHDLESDYEPGVRLDPPNEVVSLRRKSPNFNQTRIGKFCFYWIFILLARIILSSQNEKKRLERLFL